MIHFLHGSERAYMRLLAIFASLLALAGVAYGGHALWQALQAPLPAAALAPPPAPAAAAPDDTRPTTAPRHWPAVFGAAPKAEPQPPAPPTPPVAAQPPKPPMPPIESLGFALKGMVRNGTGDWAIVTHPTGEQILRVGDELTPGVTVVEITAEGLWVERDGERSLLGFLEN